MSLEDLIDNKLYVVAGERNMRAAGILGGLYANVGMTSRTVQERLKDRDYRRKNSGGNWLVILKDTRIGKFSDYHVHAELKKRKDILWNSEGTNTEEFLFINDPGDGSIARKIVLDCINQLLVQNKQKLEIINESQTEEEEVKDRLKAMNIRRISNFTDTNIYWFKVINSFVRRTQRGQPYIIVKFDDASGKHNGMFVWNTMKPLETGSMWLGKVYECKKGIAVKRHNLKSLIMGPNEKAELEKRSLERIEYSKSQDKKLSPRWKEIQSQKSDQKNNDNTKPVKKDIVKQTEKISGSGKIFIFFLNIVAIIYLFDFIFNYR